MESDKQEKEEKTDDYDNKNDETREKRPERTTLFVRGLSKKARYLTFVKKQTKRS